MRLVTQPRASLFISTFDMPRHLTLVCAALEGQSTRDFEILFCDDGSSHETATVIREFTQRSAIPAQHIWHEHKGFRKCKILNQAVRKARGEVFIFLDGDCIPHRDYVLDHLNQQEPGRYLAGRRVELGRDLSLTLTPELIRGGFFDRPKLPLILSAIRGDTEYLNRSIRIPWQWLRRLLKMNQVVDMKGCNYSIPRSALESINGFDEAYEGYGREDTDVEIRLQNLGLKIKSMKGLALQFHIWHPRRGFTPSNDKRLELLKSSGRVRCAMGLDSTTMAGR